MGGGQVRVCVCMCVGGGSGAGGRGGCMGSITPCRARSHRTCSTLGVCGGELLCVVGNKTETGFQGFPENVGCSKISKKRCLGFSSERFQPKGRNGHVPTPAPTPTPTPATLMAIPSIRTGQQIHMNAQPRCLGWGKRDLLGVLSRERVQPKPWVWVGGNGG